MANEIIFQGKLRFAKGSDFGAFDLGEISATQTGNESLRGRQTVTTAEEALVIGEVNASAAHFMCKNMNTSGSSKLLIQAASGAAPTVEVWPSETSGPFRFPTGTTAPFVKASSLTVDFIYWIVEA